MTIPCALTGDRATINRLNNRNNAGLQISAVRAEIINSGECSAEGHSARGHSPVLQLCRLLVAAGHDPARPLHAFRGNMLCLVIRSIGEAAGLEINAHGSRFGKLEGSTGKDAAECRCWRD